MLCHVLLRAQGEGNQLLLVLPKSPERKGISSSPSVPLPEAQVTFPFCSCADFVSRFHNEWTVQVLPLLSFHLWPTRGQAPGPSALDNVCRV